MFKPLHLLLGGLFLVAFVSPAKAGTYVCHVSGEMSGVKLGFIFGGQVIRGNGEIHCNSHTENLTFPARLSIVGGGAGFDFTIVRNVKLLSASIAGVASPSQLAGRFSVSTTTGVNLIDQGRKVDSAIFLSKPDSVLSFEVGMFGEDAVGLGARVHGLAFVIEPGW